jgi:hypothetical protein
MAPTNVTAANAIIILRNMALSSRRQSRQARSSTKVWGRNAIEKQITTRSQHIDFPDLFVTIWRKGRANNPDISVIRGGFGNQAA